MQYNINWSAENTLDLMSPDGTFVRAFRESAVLANYAGGSDSAYPGFQDAITATIDRSFYDAEWPYPHVYGNEYNRIFEFTELAADKVQIIACAVQPHSFPMTPIPKPEVPGNGNVTAYRLIYQRQGTSPPSNQQGNREVPYASVFGDWKAIEYDSNIDIDTPEAVTPCLTANYKFHYTHSPEPGWPESPQPLA
ncbi:hypothetical protein [Williamsia sp.]|uniref:hypothetical protein n=1 Tax=Williamsia sp. TaxID=1872085 RepID=UPI002F95EF5E